MRASTTRQRRRGFTMTEVVTVVAIAGIMSAIAIPAYTGYLDKTRGAIASNLLETLNDGLHRFNEGNYELLYPAADGSTSDEMTVLRTLQYRKPVNPIVGSPYVRNNWSPLGSSSANDYRIVWTGSLFKLLTPGQSGTGLKVAFDASDLGTPYNFPSNFSMAGQ
jgi:prepilin-type N-terminal cleavage/methylation domain-containing protein